jgi:hypothetical protein
MGISCYPVLNSMFVCRNVVVPVVAGLLVPYQNVSTYDVVVGNSDGEVPWSKLVPFRDSVSKWGSRWWSSQIETRSVSWFSGLCENCRWRVLLVPCQNISTYNSVGNPDGELNHDVVVVCHFVEALRTLCRSCSYSERDRMVVNPVHIVFPYLQCF